MLFTKGFVVVDGGGVWIDSLGCLVICEVLCRMGVYGIGMIIVGLDVDDMRCREIGSD